MSPVVMLIVVVGVMVVAAIAVVIAYRAGRNATPQAGNSPSAQSGNTTTASANATAKMPEKPIVAQSKAPVYRPPPPPDDDEDDNDITQVGSAIGMADEDSKKDVTYMLLSAVGQTDVGRKRKLNEDSYLIEDSLSVFAVADGMGGHAAGDVASQLCISTLESAFKKNLFDGRPSPVLPPRGDELVRAVKMANKAIFAQAQGNEAQKGMGTTLVAIRFSPRRQMAYIAHVGDSRCYRFRNGKFEQLTEDHTFNAYGLKGAGSNALTRAVGYEGEVEVDLSIDEPKPGDCYVLCSDGLTKMVPDDMIAKMLNEETDIETICNNMIKTANERGGKDNITVILVRVQNKSASG